MFINKCFKRIPKIYWPNTIGNKILKAGAGSGEENETGIHFKSIAFFEREFAQGRPKKTVIDEARTLDYSTKLS